MVEPQILPTKPRNYTETDKTVDRLRVNTLGGAFFEYIEQGCKDAGDLTVSVTSPAGTNQITDTLPAPAEGKMHRIEVRVRVWEQDADKIRMRGE